MSRNLFIFLFYTHFGDTIETLYILSIIGSIGGMIGTTFITFKMNLKGYLVWLVGNGCMLAFTSIMGYWDQFVMWVYYEGMNVIGILNWYGRLDGLKARWRNSTTRERLIYFKSYLTKHDAI